MPSRIDRNKFFRGVLLGQIYFEDIKPRAWIPMLCHFSTSHKRFPHFKWHVLHNTNTHLWAQTIPPRTNSISVWSSIWIRGYSTVGLWTPLYSLLLCVGRCTCSDSRYVMLISCSCTLPVPVLDFRFVCSSQHITTLCSDTCSTWVMRVEAMFWWVASILELD